MKTYLHALAMCQSMFCAIPCPWKVWDEEARSKMLLFLPIIGVEIGAVWAALAWLCSFLALPTLVTGLILCVYPYIVTGYLHLDGFMDVIDAVRSWRDLERRRQILKDSHVGSFAVIGVLLLMLAQFALFSSVPAEANCLILLFVPAISRCCSTLAVTGLKSMSTSQYADQKKQRSHLVSITIVLCALLAAGFLLCGRYGFVSVGCIAGYSLALRRGYRSLAGMNGDISGYALTIGELCAVAIYALI